MATTIEPYRFAGQGKAGRIKGPAGSGIDVHLDVIVSIRRGSEYRRTETALEKGAALTVHRQRVPQTLVLEVVVSDVQPDALALVTGRWELRHAAKTLERLIEAQAYDQELRVWNGAKFERTPAGSRVWVLDNIDHELTGTEYGVLRATLTFGESPRFATSFTTALPDVDESLEDVTGDSAERGRQSTTEASADAADEVVQEVWF